MRSKRPCRTHARVAGAGQRVLGDGAAQLGRGARSASSAHERVVVEVEQRLRQSPRESRRKLGVHVVVGGDVETRRDAPPR